METDVSRIMSVSFSVPTIKATLSLPLTAVPESPSTDATIYS